MKLHSIPPLVIAQLLFLVAPAMACKHTPPEWQQRVQKHALAAMIGQQKHLTWSRDQPRGRNAPPPKTAQDRGCDRAGVHIRSLDTGADEGYEPFRGKCVGGLNTRDAADPGDGSARPGDESGHGTRVAGISCGKA